ncbi:cell division protein FtsQ/DivIB [Gracilibacillus alcaliphilus]|uniref:cell division protein FtsQ/DivIB n=1 Tax=Gracilibacillus alcaliphilus TaxID=1401441 RepID=UPI0019562993|nr:FtsQ-type POTRA domain-containing protein [Gracilibacillus alcaliphilus]MBM7678621.1 cell division protein FtsQ [Gracilibacillus alcaliphilus]
MAQKRVVSIEDRIPKLKQERRKRANRKLVMYVFIFFVLIFIVIYLQSPMSYVRHVNVTGLTWLDQEEIKKQSEIEEDANFWSVRSSQVEENILTNPQIKEVHVTKSFPSTINIEVHELSHVAYANIDGELHPLLENGDMLQKVNWNEANGEVPILTGFEEDAYLKEFSDELAHISTYVTALISEVQWLPTESNPYHIQLYMTDGNVVESTIRNFSSVFNNYPSIASQLDSDVQGVIKIDEGGAVFTPYDAGEDEEEGEEGETDEADEA